MNNYRVMVSNLPVIIFLAFLRRTGLQFVTWLGSQRKLTYVLTDTHVIRLCFLENGKKCQNYDGPEISTPLYNMECQYMSICTSCDPHCLLQ